MNKIIIVVNIGSTSTKVALFDINNKLLVEKSVSYTSEQLAKFDNVADQFDLRLREIENWLTQQNINSKKVVAVAGRGAPMRPLKSGTYNINEKMLEELKSRQYSNHASNLSPMIARFLGDKYNVFAIDISYLVPTNNRRNPLDNTLRFTLQFDFEALTGDYAGSDN